MSSFEYFPTFPAGAQLGTDACAYCGNTPAIPAVRLKPAPGEDNSKAACADCLRAGRASAKVPTWIVRDLAYAVDAAHPAWSTQQRAELVASRIDKLAHTPPVPWLQNNEWPICGDDFAVYIGEMTRERLVRKHEGVEPAQVALQNILKKMRPEWHLDEEALDTAWAQLGNFVAVFAFRCPKSPQDKTLYVIQTA